MQLSAQLTSALAGIVLIIPLYYLGKTLFDARIAFWAVALFQVLPVGSRVLSDALSEGVFLLAMTFGLLVACWAFRKVSALGFALCGLCAGVAFLTRPEGALLVVAVFLVLVNRQLLRAVRLPWQRFVICGASLGLAAAVVAAPYVLTIGHLTNKTTGLSVLHARLSREAVFDLEAMAPHELKHQPLQAMASISGPPLANLSLGAYRADYGKAQSSRRLAWSLEALGGETLKGFHYGAALAALLGCFWGRHCVRREAGLWVVLTLCGLQMVVLWRVAYVAGYVAERHPLLIVMVGLFWTVTGIFAFASGVWPWLNRLATRRRMPRLSAWLAAGGAQDGAIRLAICLVLVLGITALPKTMEPLHTTRAGYHAAGLWLAEHSRPEDIVIDPFSWAEYYAGRTFQEENPPPPGYQPAQYVVLGGSENEHGRLPMIPIAEALATRGSLVFQWPTGPYSGKAERVVVYCVPPRVE
jgi:4-amino-4-deoxy-L-arabinose transferase-like glycosyltransferase